MTAPLTFLKLQGGVYVVGDKAWAPRGQESVQTIVARLHEAVDEPQRPVSVVDLYGGDSDHRRDVQRALRQSVKNQLDAIKHRCPALGEVLREGLQITDQAMVYAGSRIRTR